MNIDSISNDGRISSENILESIINLKQLVFEVTDACNLQCKYCAYGDLYFGYDKREDSFLSLDKGKAIIDYLCSIWSSYTPISTIPTTYVSFYGGEPLMNMVFIKAIVEYIQSLDIRRHIIFSMTTNGILLDKYIEYLALHKFNILISLDGDIKSDGYRVTRTGKTSFERVFKNAKMIQNRYPDYFREHVNFNSVLHNLNNVESLCDFFTKNFGKMSTISELNASNIKDERKNEFLAMYQNKEESIIESSDPNALANKLLMENPRTHDLILFLHQYSGNVYRNYSDLFSNKNKLHFCPTGTCVPFGKKMFITVNGKILQCEKISQNYALGHIDADNVVRLDFDDIANKFNALLDKVQHQCSNCFSKKSCKQCVYYINGIKESKPNCQGFMTKKSFDLYASRNLSYLYEHPKLYNKLLSDIIVE